MNERGPLEAGPTISAHETVPPPDDDAASGTRWLFGRPPPDLEQMAWADRPDDEQPAFVRAMDARLAEQLKPYQFVCDELGIDRERARIRANGDLVEPALDGRVRRFMAREQVLRRWQRAQDAGPPVIGLTPRDQRARPRERTMRRRPGGKRGPPAGDDPDLAAREGGRPISIRTADPDATPEFRWAILYQPTPSYPRLGDLALTHDGWTVLAYFVTLPVGPLAAAAFMLFELYEAADVLAHELEWPPTRILELRAIAAARAAARSDGEAA